GGGPKVALGRVLRPLPRHREPEVQLLQLPQEGMAEGVGHALPRHAVPAQPRPHHAHGRRRARPGGHLLDGRAHSHDGADLLPGGRVMKATRNKQRGVALLMVLAWIAMMVALVAEFTYGTNVDAAQAANARDELRAHYLARSSVNLSRLLIKIQKQFVDP